VRLFLDNCLAVRHARALHSILEPEGHSVVHLRDKFTADIPDAKWLHELGKEGDWVVISGDVRIVRNAHEREAWHQSGLTVFFLKPGWTNIAPLEQHAKFAHCLQDLIECARRAKPGSGFTVTPQGKIEQIYP
jgi:hypothetical protein